MSEQEWITSRAPWQPQIPLQDVRFDIVEAARCRRDVLQKLLPRVGVTPMTELIEIALRDFKVSGELRKIPSVWTIRRWIEDALNRDAGRQEFHRIALYLQGPLVRKQRGSNSSPVICTMQDACALYFNLLKSGVLEHLARRKVLNILRSSPVARPKSNATRMAFNCAIRKFEQHGEVRDLRKGNSGRRPRFVLSENEENALRHWRLKKNSLPLAIEEFANDPDCRPETRAKIQEEFDLAAREKRLPRWPMSIQRAGYVSDDEKGFYRGPKHFQEFEVIERRGMWIVDLNGQEIQIAGNMLFESDDMSSNAPARYVDPETGATRVGRQLLATMNVYAAAWLGVSPVGRERDAYRLEDIADHLLEIIRAHGLPMIWRFERGPWENSVIDGIKLGDGTRWGDLSPLFQVVHAFKSRSKGLIESSFSLLQSLIDHESLTIGRSRGEFERATKLFLAAGRGDASAAAHFWDISEMADAYAAAMIRFNERPKIRRAFGRQAVVPADLQRTAGKRECQKSELWRFSPVKRQATVRRGAVEVSIAHYPFPFRFRINGASDIYLERGYSVLIAFHPGRPEEGCHIFNAETGSRNRDGLKLGEFLFVAPFAEDAPQLNLRPDEYAFAARKNANAAVRSEFRAITASGATASRSSVARDGFGNSAVQSSGAALDGINHARHAAMTDDDRRSEKGDTRIHSAMSKSDEEILEEVKALEAEAIRSGRLRYE